MMCDRARLQVVVRDWAVGRIYTLTRIRIHIRILIHTLTRIRMSIRIRIHALIRIQIRKTLAKHIQSDIKTTVRTGSRDHAPTTHAPTKHARDTHESSGPTLKNDQHLNAITNHRSESKKLELSIGTSARTTTDGRTTDPTNSYGEP